MIVYAKSSANASYNGQWENLEEFVNNSHPNDVSLQVFGPEMSFMKQISDYKARKCALIKMCKGGSGVNADMINALSWNVDNNGLPYQMMKSYIRDGLDKLSLLGIPDLKAFFWFQGYNDSDTLAHATDYEDNLTALIEGPNGMREILREMNDEWRKIPIYILQSPRSWVGSGVRTLANLEALTASKQAVAALNDNSYFVPDPGYSLFVDNIHITGDNLNNLLPDTMFNLVKDL